MAVTGDFVLSVNPQTTCSLGLLSKHRDSDWKPKVHKQKVTLGTDTLTNARTHAPTYDSRHLHHDITIKYSSLNV